MQLQPNNSRVVGIVRSIGDTLDDQGLYKIIISVKSSHDIRYFPNHTKHAVGKDLRVYIHEKDYQRLGLNAKLSLDISETSNCPSGTTPLCKYVGSNVKRI